MNHVEHEILNSSVVIPILVELTKYKLNNLLERNVVNFPVYDCVVFV